MRVVPQGVRKMPIYEYRCADCGFQNEYLQKVSEPPMTVCPSCGKESFRKLLTAAGFQLKGKGASRKPQAEGAKSDAAGGESKADAKTEAKSESKSESSNSTSSDKDATSASAAG